jgi:hypothetical protein
MAGNVLQLAGVYWDLGWHHSRLRDTFWSPPHLAIYSGVALALLAAAAGLLADGKTTQRTRGGAFLRAYRVALAGPMIQVAAAPIDELWHRVIGPDVSVWSPPHLLGILGGLVGAMGWILVLAPSSGTGHRDRLTTILTCAFAVFLLAGALIALGEYDHDQTVREPWLYPGLTALLSTCVLLAARSLLRWTWGATLVATAYTVLRLTLAAGVWAMGFPWMGVPPLILGSAIVVDLLSDRIGPGKAGAVCGIAFTVSDYPLTYLVSGRAWSAFEWVGSLLLAAVAGWLGAGIMAGGRWCERTAPGRPDPRSGP